MTHRTEVSRAEEEIHWAHPDGSDANTAEEFTAKTSILKTLSLVSAKT